MAITNKLTAIANAIRSLLGTSGTYTLVQMESALNGIAKKGAHTYVPSANSQTINAGQYLSGTQTISGDANLVSDNIKSGVSIFGVVGTHQGGEKVGVVHLDNILFIYTGVTATKSGTKLVIGG